MADEMMAYTVRVGEIAHGNEGDHVRVRTHPSGHLIGDDEVARSGGTKESLAKLPQGTSSPSTPVQSEEERTKAERLAKIQAWKKKQLEIKQQKEREVKAADVADPQPTETVLVAGAAGVISSARASSPGSTADDEIPSKPYAGKFDPKAIIKKATAGAAASMTTLGKGVPKSGQTQTSATLKSMASGMKADKLPTVGSRTTKGTASTLPKDRANLSGFGIGGRATTNAERTTAKHTLDFGDEEATKKKLEKLPTPPLEDSTENEDAAPANDAEEDDDDDIDMEGAGNEEEIAAAARAAAEKREERLQNATNSAQEVDEHHVNGTELPASQAGDQADANGQSATRKEPAVIVEIPMQDDIDPLDAFMSGLGEADAPLETPMKHQTASKSKNRQAPEALFGDEDIDLDVIDADPDDILAMASKTRKKKDMPTVNHAKVEYAPFRKKFYTEPTELAQMTEEEVADLRLELDGIKIRGVDAPKPVQKWSQCGLGSQSLTVIQKLGYDAPTSIQTQAIPAIMSGRDVIGVAKTGSGKTIAFLLPMFRHIKDQQALASMDGPIGLVMTPTRELATQIHKECKPFLKALNLRAVCAYGGAPIKDQIADLKRGAEIIVCTPGRMIDLLAANSGRVTNLRRVTYIVLDEADRMFDMGFEPQVMKVIANIRPDKQTVLFSATFPRQMEALARKTLRQPVEIVVGGRSVVAPEITQIVEVRSEESKFLRLLELLGDLYDRDEDARTLIFVDRQESADGLLRDLMRKGYPCMSIHGGKDQIDRDSTIDDFKAGVVPIMIATSVAARGLDVKQLKLVVNFDAPNHLEDYVHRAGRTGRAGNTGTAVTFLREDQERYSVDIAKALRQSGQTVPEAVQKLVDSFVEKVKAGKEKASGSGFGGKGLERLDQDRDAARNRERKTYKTEEGGDDDEKEKDEKEDDIIAKAASGVKPAAPAITAAASLIPKGIDLDGKITVHKTEAAAPVTGAVRGATSKNALSQVEQAVAAIRERLNQGNTPKAGVPIDNKGPDAGAFHATLEINDFPQKARWAVTNRTNVAKILEATGTSITTKGSFYPAGKDPKAGEEAKLYILVEGDTEVVVTNAMRELMRLLKEGTVAAADSDARAPASGRYNVL